MKTYHIEAIGCKVNQYEAQQISEFLQQLGLQAAEPEEPPDLAVVHTCAVTARALAKSRRAVSRCLRNQAAALLVSGCAARWAGSELSKLAPTVKLVPQAQDIASVLYKITKEQGAPNNNSATINQGSKAPGRNKQCMMTATATTTTVANGRTRPLSNHIQPPSSGQVKSKICAYGVVDKPPKSTERRLLGPITRFSGHQRAFVKVQDGCDSFCSYCLVPYLRPRLSWRRPRDVLQEVKKLVQNGYREVVLAGIHLGAYGRETAVKKSWAGRPQVSLADLLEQLAAVPALQRIRLSSLAPGELTPEILDVMAENSIIARHLHLSLQSGSKKILKDMNRQYTPQEYLETVQRARRRCGRMTITTDVIVGFPGETSEDFQATMALAEQVRFARTHVFEFSPRTGTAAARMSGQVPKRISKERSRQMRRLGELLARQCQEKLLGQELRILVEAKRSSDGLQAGLSEQYFSVRFRSEQDLAGRMVSVMLEGIDEIGAHGSLIAGSIEGRKSVPKKVGRKMPLNRS